MQHAFQIVLHAAQINHFHRQFLQTCHQGVAVAVVNLVGTADVCARLVQFIAGGHNRHFDFAVYRHLGKAQRRQQHHIGIAQNAPGQQYGVARRHFFTRVANIGALADVGIEGNALIIGAHIFLQHHTAAGRRHHGAGHDAHAAIIRYFSDKSLTRHRFTHQLPLAACSGGGGQGVAVHGGNIGIGDVDGRHRVCGQHPPGRLGHRHLLDVGQLSVMADFGGN